MKPSALSPPNKSSRILEQQNQLPVVFGGRLEAKAPVKRLCLAIEGMCQHRPNASMLSDGDGAMRGVL